MIILKAAPFDPPLNGAVPVPVHIALQMRGRPVSPYVDASAYVDPGADYVCIRHDWLALTAEKKWKQTIPNLETGAIEVGLSFLIKIGEWTEEVASTTPAADPIVIIARGDVQSLSLSDRRKLEKRFKNNEKQFLRCPGREALLLGAPLLAPLCLIYTDRAMTLVDPRKDARNAGLVERIRLEIEQH